MMFHSHRSFVLQLADGEHVRCDHACVLRVLSGQVWITQMNDPDDHFLDAGQTMVVRTGARALVGAEGVAQIAMQRLSRSDAAAPSRTIAAWTCPPTN
jgi:hypothetical protein